MKSKRIRAMLLHILEDIQDIDTILQYNTKEKFQSESILKKAVCMSLINIGEMARHLPETLTSEHPEIPWGSVVGLRNRVAHGYHVLDTDVVWDIMNNDLKRLKEVVTDALEIITKKQEDLF